MARRKSHLDRTLIFLEWLHEAGVKRNHPHQCCHGCRAVFRPWALPSRGAQRACALDAVLDRFPEVRMQLSFRTRVWIPGWLAAIALLVAIPTAGRAQTSGIASDISVIV